MKHKAFTEIVAHTTRVPEGTVAMFGRNLKSAGLLTTGARGVNAPEMTVLDLTRMLIALCATDRPADAVEATNRYRLARCVKGGKIEIEGEEVGTVEEDDTLEEVLSGILGLPFIVLRMLNPCFFIHWNRLESELLIQDTRIVFRADLTEEEKETQFGGSFAGISTRRGLDTHELSEMAVPFYIEKEEGTTWEEMKETGSAAKVAARHIFGVKDEGGGNGDT